MTTTEGTASEARRETVDEAGIAVLVNRFYGKIRQDPQLASVFEAAVSDWEPHLDTMRRFWASAVLRAGTYHGSPMRKHAALPGLTPELFGRWLELFDETLAELYAPPLAAAFSERAHLIARSLQLGLFYRP
jgi:hemoglobin